MNAALQSSPGDNLVELLASLPHNNPKPVLLVDRTGDVLYANPAAQRLAVQWQSATVVGILPLEHPRLVAEALRSQHGADSPHAVDPVGMIGTTSWRYRVDTGGEVVQVYAEQQGTAKQQSDVAPLRRGLAQDELVPFFQPIVRADDEVTVGFEALARWAAPGGLMSPAQFIPLAEETGLIAEIDRRILEKAAEQFVAWGATSGAARGLKLSVNLSAQAISDPSITQSVARVIERTGIDPARLCLEITESSLVADPQSAQRSLEALKTLGVCVALDDFGTGYSSLSYLHRFPIDRIKIDRSFVLAMSHDEKAAKIVAAIVGLAKGLGLACVAEGVETPEQLAALRALGCDYLQGFIFAAPLPAAEAGAWIPDASARRGLRSAC